MKPYLSLFLTLFLLISCSKNNVELPGTLIIKSSSYDLPLNKYGRAVLKAKDGVDGNFTDQTEFYINGEKIVGNIFRPEEVGIFTVKGNYKGIESEDIEITVESPLNKKILVEYYTSKGCGWCPWMGYRADSLHQKNKQVISYSIHGDDELEVDGVEELQIDQKAWSRPAIRVNRGFVRDFLARVEITGLLDSIDHFLSIQPPLEMAIESTITGNELSIDIKGKIYRELSQEIYLSLILIEDDLLTNNQANYFNDEPFEDCLYTSLPNPIPEYKNHNVLRGFISDVLGSKIPPALLVTGQVATIGSYNIVLDNILNEDKAFIIAIVHTKRDNVDISSVLNAQIVKIGESVHFDE